MTPGGLPHSGIRGSTPADGYPRLIAAFHALLRLVAPRHPPCALNSSAPRNAPCRANRIELNHAHMLLLRCVAYPDQWVGRPARFGIRVRQQKTDPPGGWIGDVPAAMKGSYPSIGSFQHVESSESWVPRLAFVPLAFACGSVSISTFGESPQASRWAFLDSNQGPVRSSDRSHEVVGVPGLEPGTSVLSGLRSNQLS